MLNYKKFSIHLFYFFNTLSSCYLLDSTPNINNPSSTSTKTTTNNNISTKHASSSKISTTVKCTNDKTFIQQDPTKSDLYKSLFTTSAAAKKKEQNKAHWITYNPLYF